MCGIVGIVGKNPAAERLIHGLSKLEYRGYDSAGVATLYEGKLGRVRAAGKLQDLQTKLSGKPLAGSTGIGHTRWATHGKASEVNAHPHMNERVAVVHNGIIENHKDLRKMLEKEGYVFESDTDTEVIAHLIGLYREKGLPPVDAVGEALQQLRGSFALALLFSDHDSMMIVARRGGSPLAIGYGDGEMYVGSDALALTSLTHKISYLEDGDWAVLFPDRVTMFDKENRPVSRDIQMSRFADQDVTKGSHAHFMLKEIYEQPEVLKKTLEVYLQKEQITLPELPWDTLSRLTLSACGTAYYAGLMGKYWFERFARLSADIDVASEFRYRMPPLPEKGLGILISQSGETIDTLAALEYMKGQHQEILSLVNVPESSIARESDIVLTTQAGPEIAVASTKAFTGQMMVLALLVLDAAHKRKTLSEEELRQKIVDLRALPDLYASILKDNGKIKAIASQIVEARDALFLGRGPSYLVALEGALKLKEITYIHGEAYAAGELKHGPIALLDPLVPVIVVAPFDEVFDKTASNIQEVAARGSPVIVLTDQKGAPYLSEFETLILPETTPLTSPFIYTLPLQLLAYYTALLRGTDVDQPRNLAKSVTVE